jgi:ABC-type lipoprotein export system ATPase subunit
MKYWHMQLHPASQQWGREKELLEKKSMIGLGMTDSKIAFINFKDDMSKDDIVLIKNGSKVIALVEVIGNFTDVKVNDDDRLNWFRYNRKVNVLQFASSDMLAFPQPRKTIQKATNKYTLSYQYIHRWYKDILKNEKTKGLKIQSIYIDEYKVLNDFDINFMDDKDTPLSLAVIIGKNGTGKTTLFDFLTSLQSDYHYDIKYTLDGKNYDKLQNYSLIGTTKIKDNIAKFIDNIIYLKAGISGDKENEKLEKLFLDYIDYFIYEQSMTSSDGYEALQNDLKEIFDGFDINFSFSNIDYKNKIPLFNNETLFTNAIKIQLKDLSTGEKTLLSKIFYLYLNEPKNKVILIDEPELSLHPTWQNKVIGVYEKFAKINNNQIIIATHSPHILSGVETKAIKLLRIYDRKITVIDNFSQGFGLEFQDILTDIMEIDTLRTPVVENLIRDIKDMIVNDKSKDHEFKIKWNNLEKYLGKDDLTLRLLKLEIHRKEKCLK